MADINFIKRFEFGDGYVSVAIGHPSRDARYYPVPFEATVDASKDREAYFAPAVRKTPGDTKEDVLGSRALWVDIDVAQYPQSTFPPTYTVWSGHGWHLYWMLEKPILDVERLELYNQILAKDVPHADKACWNANRYLRIPDSYNLKDPACPAIAEIRKETPVLYGPEDFETLSKLDSKTRHKIATGDRRGYRSRSERDWAVVTSLIASGASDALIDLLFTYQPIGDKVNDPTTNKGYLAHTIAQVRSRKPTGGESGIVEQPDGYYVGGRGGLRRVSTFLVHPRLLLDATQYGGQDALVGDIVASGHTWTGITLSRSAFTAVHFMDRECPVAAWQWLGNDLDVRKLLPHLLDHLQEKGMPRVVATPVLGLTEYQGKWYFVGTSETLSANQLWDGFEGPLAWLPSKKEHPEMALGRVPPPAEKDFLRATLPLLNTAESFWTMMGWYAASPLKPWFEKQGLRFPILNVTGTKGSGKTTLIQRVFMPLLGQCDPRSYDAGTTKFVMLALLGGTNAIPIAFSEFRYSSVEGFLRYILLAYDTGHDPRGRPDQTTIDYPLSAPFSVDGEDLIGDPAAQERIVVVQLHPATICEDGEAARAYHQLQDYGSFNVAGEYIGSLLSVIETGTLLRSLQQARASILEAYPKRIPERVRNNHIVTYLGAILWADYIGLPRPPAEILDDSIRAVFNLESGKVRTSSDAFVEDIVNGAAAKNAYFKWHYDGETKVLWFQLASAHGWWMARLRGQGRMLLEREAIRSQLKECDYVKPTQVVDGTLMYGVDLVSASKAGLDVPTYLKESMTIDY